MRSNAYTYKFIIVITGLAAFLLALASTGLSERQEFNRQLDTKKNILKSVGEFNKEMTPKDVEKAYNQYITKKSIDEDGNIIDEQNDLTFFEYHKDGAVKGYIIPISGKGLWSTIKGFFAVGMDRNTVLGITFYEHGETPGLGGEIEKDWFTNQFVGKKIFSSMPTLVSPEKELISITIAKGESSIKDDHHVDGISGATLTTKGVNDFLLRDLKKYEKFLKKFDGC
ncbi:MAG: NADH:ubiquinone reductase (Na(+)-transporting) subunit C [Fidelibacterota bacterium]